MGVLIFWQILSAVFLSLAPAQAPQGCLRNYEGKCFDSIFELFRSGDGEGAWQALSMLCRGRNQIACDYLAKLEFVLNKPTAMATFEKICRLNETKCLEDVDVLTSYGWAQEMSELEKEICKQNSASAHCSKIIPRTLKLDRLIHHFALNVHLSKKQAQYLVRIADKSNDPEIEVINVKRFEDLEPHLSMGSKLKLSISNCSPPAMSTVPTDEFFSYMNCQIDSIKYGIRIVSDFTRLQKYIKGFLPSIPLAKRTSVKVITYDSNAKRITVSLE